MARHTYNLNIFKRLIKPDFNWKLIEDEDELIEIAHEILFLKEIHQRILGKIALAVDTSKTGKLEELAEKIGVSSNSLRTYQWVEKRLGNLDVPIDIAWSSLRTVSNTDDPVKWVKRIIREKLNLIEVERLMKIEKYRVKPPKGKV